MAADRVQLFDENGRYWGTYPVRVAACLLAAPAVSGDEYDGDTAPGNELEDWSDGGQR